MASKDLHNHIDVKRGISPSAVVVDNTPFVSEIVDTAGFEAAEFIILTGSLADADATFTVLVEDGDTSNLADASAVADAYLLGTEILAGFTFAHDNSTRKIGYVGGKRYVRVTVTPSANSGNAFIAGAWLLGNPRNVPTANPPA
jgi:hypothetical protein